MSNLQKVIFGQEGVRRKTTSEFRISESVKGCVLTVSTSPRLLNMLMHDKTRKI